jgi:hypothetical protein
VLDHDPHRLELLVGVDDLLGLRVQHHRAVVDGVVERGAREHQGVGVEDRDARLVARLAQVGSLRF